MKMAHTRAHSATVLRPVSIVLAGIAALTASSYIAVPLWPVPVTMQTLAVIAMGALLGPRMGAGIVLAWLGAALAGAPLLAGGAGGPAAFVGPTAGYLVAFPVAAFLAGYLPRAMTAAGHATRFAGYLALHALILASGWAWLATLIGAEAALVAGVAPFLIGSVLKGGLAAAIFAIWPARWRMGR